LDRPKSGVAQVFELLRYGVTPFPADKQAHRLMLEFVHGGGGGVRR